MGQLRFMVSPPQCITEEVLQFTYMSGMDRTPWIAEVEREDDELVMERDVDDSGCVTVPWHVEGHGDAGPHHRHADRALGALSPAAGARPRNPQPAADAAL